MSRFDELMQEAQARQMESPNRRPLFGEGSQPEIETPSQSLMRIRQREDGSLREAAKLRAPDGSAVTPEIGRRVLGVARRTGLPEPFIRENIDDLERKIAEQDFDPAEFRKTSPALAEWMQGSPERSAAVLAERTSMQDVEEYVMAIAGQGPHGAPFRAMQQKSWGVAKGLLTGVLEGAEMAGVGVPEAAGAASRLLYRAGAPVLPDWFLKMDEAVSGFLFDPSRSGAIGEALAGRKGWDEVGLGRLLNPFSSLTTLGETAGAVADITRPTEEQQSFASDVATGVGQMGFQIATAMASGGVAAPVSLTNLFGMGAFIQKEMIDDARSRGLEISDRDRDIALLLGGLSTAATERVGLHFVMERLPPPVRRKLAQGMLDILIAGGAEGLQEMTDALMQNLIAKGIYDPEQQAFDDALFYEGGVGFSAGAVSRFLLTTVLGVRARSFGTKTEAALAELDGHLGKVQLREKDPDTFEEVIKAMRDKHGSDDVYVDSTAFQTYWQSMGEDPREVAREILGDESPYIEGALVGGRFKIPLEKYARHLANTPAAEALRQHMAFSPDTPTVAEAVQFEAEQQTLLAEFDEAIQTARSPEAVALYDEILGSLTNVLPRSTAEPVARMLASTMMTQASRMTQGGKPMTGLELWRSNPIDFARQLPEILTRMGSGYDIAIDPLLDRLRAGDVPTQQDAFGPSLFDFLREQGGLQEMSGELAARDLSKAQGLPGQRRLVSEQGMHLDRAAELAAEAGYIEDATIDALLDAIDSESRGDRVFTLQRASAQAQNMRLELEALQEQLDRMGADLQKLTNEQVKQVLAGKLDPAAVEAAVRAAGEGDNRTFIQRAIDRVSGLIARRAGPVTETEEFLRWFGSSKAVKMVSTKTGEAATSSREESKAVPLVMYHTTRGESFDSFQIGRETINSSTFGDYSTTRAAFFVTPSVSDSQAYGQIDGRFVDGAAVMPLYVRAEDPLDLSEGLKEADYKRMSDFGWSDGFIFNRLGSWEMFDGEEGAQVVEDLKAMGYDSVVFNDQNPVTGDSFESWALFDPNQVKSATANVGDFSRESVNVLFQLVQRASQLAQDEGVNSRMEQEFFGEIWPRLLDAAGERFDPSGDGITKAAEHAVKEISDWLQENPRFADYYTKDWSITRDILEQHYGQQITDEQFAVFRFLTGVTSLNTPLKGNIADAVNAFELFMRDGNFSAIELSVSQKGATVIDKAPFLLSNTTNGIKARSMVVFDQVVREQGSVAAAISWLMEPVPYLDLHKVNVQLGYKGPIGNMGFIRDITQQATGQKDLVPRMFVLGPKIGAYTMNALGDGRYTTIDVWESRYIRSQFNGLLDKNLGLPVGRAEQELFIAFADEFEAAWLAAGNAPMERSAMQAARWFYILEKARKAGYSEADTSETISYYTAEALGAGVRGADPEGGRRGYESGLGAVQKRWRPYDRKRAQSRRIIDIYKSLRGRVDVGRSGKRVVPRVFRRRDSRDRKGIIAEFSLDPADPQVNDLRKLGVSQPTLIQLNPNVADETGVTGAQRFLAAITAAKRDNKFGAAVYVYSEDEYRKMKLFITEDGTAGIAVKSDGDIVSVFNFMNGPHNLVARHLLLMAMEAGGKKMDNFDTVLTPLYESMGFEVVRRDPWNEDYKPEGWDKATFAKWNNGEPDVVYMEYAENQKLTRLYQDEAPPPAGRPRTVEDVFTSKALRVVRDMPATKATAAQWMGILRNKGVKAEELEWLRIEPWLNSVGASVTRDQVLEFIEANRLQVTEQVFAHQMEDSLVEDLETLRLRGYEIVSEDEPGGVSDIRGGVPFEWQVVRSATGEFIDGQNGWDAPEDYQLYQGIVDAVLSTSKPKWDEYRPLTAQRGYKEILLRLPFNQPSMQQQGTYVGPHWDSTNVVAHERHYEDTVEGGDALISIEIQSDWHQTGRRRGYSEPKTRRRFSAQTRSFGLNQAGAARALPGDPEGQGLAENLAQSELAVSVAESMGSAVDQLTVEAVVVSDVIGYNEDTVVGMVLMNDPNYTEKMREIDRQASELIRTWESESAELDPNIPLDIEDGWTDGVPAAPLKKTWPEFVLKRMVAYAVDGGFDKYGWLSGEVVQDIVGGELEGMEGFYDRMLPQMAKKLFGKYGVNVRPAAVLGELPSSDQYTDESVPPPGWIMDITPELRVAVEAGFDLYQSPTRGEGYRGFIDTGRRNAQGVRAFRIVLGEKADLSTTLHELGHYYFEIMADLAEQPDAPPQIVENYARLLAYIGKTDRSEVTRNDHKTIARSFEAYLMEGRAPSADLVGAFARMRAWFIEIYPTIKGLNVDLNDEVRGVFDRLLATDEQIAAATESQALDPLFGTAEEAMMTPEEWDAYLKLSKTAQESAFLDMQRKVMAAKARESKAWWRRLRAKVEREVTEEVNRQPIYQALEYLQRGTMADGTELPEGAVKAKLSKQALVDMIGLAGLKRLPRPYVYTTDEANGLHPDFVADLFGFQSGAELVEALANVRPKRRLIKALTDDRMREMYPDPMIDGSIEQEATNAVMSGRYGELLAKELKVLEQRARPDGQPTTIQVMRMAARRILGEKSLREIDVRGYQTAAARAGRAAQQAMLNGDFDAARREKRKQLLNHELHREATRMREEVEKIRDYLKRLSKKSARQRIGKAGGDYLQQIDALVERYELTRIPFAMLHKRESLVEFLKRMEDDGHEVVVPEAVLNEAQRRNYRDVPFSELEAVRDTIKQIEHFARIKLMFKTRAERRAWEKVKAELIAAAEKLGGKEPALDPTNKGILERAGDAFADIDASLLKMEQVILWLDGNDVDGPWNRYLWRDLAAAQVQKLDLMSSKLAALRGMMEKLPKETRLKLSDLIHVPSLGQSVHREFIVAVALSWGTESNRQRIMDGNGFTDAQVAEMLDLLSKEEMDFVQEVWDTFESLWPDIADLQKRMTGITPEKIEAATVKTKHGTYRGGYYPLVYDSRKTKAGMKQEGERLRTSGPFEAGAVFATTSKGHTKARVENFAGALQLSLDTIPQRLARHIHDLTHREAVLNGHRILTDPQIRAALQKALGERREPMLYRSLKRIANDAAFSVLDGTEGWKRIFETLRLNTSVAIMGFKATTMMSQFAGITDAAEMIGRKWMQRGVMEFWRNPKRAVAYATERSGEIKYRFELKDLSVREQLGRLRGQTDIKSKATRIFFMNILIADKMVATISWIGAYQKALDEGRSDPSAREFADSVIRLTQGASGTKDLAAVQATDNTMLKWLGLFYTYFNAKYGRIRTMGRRAKRVGKGEIDQLPILLAQVWWGTFLPAVVSELLAGRGPDEDDDNWALWALQVWFEFPFLTVIGLRDIASPAIDRVLGWRSRPFDATFQMTPAQQGVATMFRAGMTNVEALQGEADMDDVFLRNLEASGYLFGLPTSQAKITGRYIIDLIEGDAEPETPVDFVRDMMFRRPDR